MPEREAVAGARRARPRLPARPSGRRARVRDDLRPVARGRRLHGGLRRGGHGGALRAPQRQHVVPPAGAADARTLPRRCCRSTPTPSRRSTCAATTSSSRRSSAWAHGVLVDERRRARLLLPQPVPLRVERARGDARRPQPARARGAAPWSSSRWRQWDWIAAQRVDRYVANSETTQRRIARYFGRDATVALPAGGDRALRAGRRRRLLRRRSRELMPHKRIDLAVRGVQPRWACRSWSIGDGPDARRLRRMAGPTRALRGPDRRPRRRRRLMRSAPGAGGHRDRGVRHRGGRGPGRRPAGRSRCAEGGVRETVVEGETGDVLRRARPGRAGRGRRARFDDRAVDPRACVENAERFDVARFARRHARESSPTRCHEPRVAPDRRAHAARARPQRRARPGLSGARRGRRPELERAALAARAAWTRCARRRGRRTRCVVVDNGSDRRLAAGWRARRPGRAGPRARAQHRLRRRGQPGDRGGRGADAVALVNTDVVLAPDWLERMRAALDADPASAAVALQDGRPRRPRPCSTTPATCCAATASASSAGASGATTGASTRPARCSPPARARRCTAATRCWTSAASTSASSPTSRTSTSGCGCAWPAGAAATSRAPSRATRGRGRRGRSPHRCVVGGAQHAAARGEGVSAALAAAGRLPPGRVGVARAARRAAARPRRRGAGRGSRCCRRCVRERRSLRRAAVVGVGEVVPAAPIRRRGGLKPPSTNESARADRPL